MKIIIILLTALTLNLTACGQGQESATTPIDNAAAPAETPQSNAGKVLALGTQFISESEVMGERVELNVWTPPKMGEEGKTYPVLYVIDGGAEQDFPHIAGLAQLATINYSHEVPIVVGIKTNKRRYELLPKPQDLRYAEFADVAGGADRFHRYIETEVIPFIESRYPNNERKLVIGESLAGYFITREFLLYPNTFTDYIAVSPSLWWDDQNLAKNAAELLKTHDNQPRNIYFTMGDEGGTMQDGLDRILKAVKDYKSDTLNMIYVDRRETETHSTIYHGAAMDALVKLMGFPAYDYGPAPWYLRDGASPEDDED